MKRFSATVALRRLQELSSDESGDDLSDNEEQQITQNSSSSDSEDEEEPSGQPTSVSAPETDSESDSTFRGKDGTIWTSYYEHFGRLPQHHIRRKESGLTSYAQRQLDDQPYSAFKLFFNESMLKHVRKCTEIEARRQTESSDWSISLDELEVFLGICYARGVLSPKIPLKKLWSNDWGCSLIQKAMPRDRFIEILRYLRFDEKSTRRTRLATDKFALASSLWEPFIENCKKSYIPSENVTVDEQLFPNKTRCPFTQYIASKPDKFGIKFFLLADVETKFICNGIPYLGKNELRPRNESLPTFVVTSLTSELANNGHTVTCDNFFTSKDLAQKLSLKGLSIVGTVRKTRRELPDSDKLLQGKPRYYSVFLSSSDGASRTNLCLYKCKKNKHVILMDTLNLGVLTDSSEKSKPEIVHYYNRTKAGVDTVDQMLRMFSTRSQTRRWPVAVFYNVLDMCLLNSWIAHKLFLSNAGSITRRDFALHLVKQLCKVEPLRQIVPLVNASGDNMDRKRKTCHYPKCRNKTSALCRVCRVLTCGNHSNGEKIIMTVCTSCVRD